MSQPVKVTVFNDPGCPWAYSAVPSLRVIDWRYREQLDWRLVLIGLTEVAQQYVDRGYTPFSMSRGYVTYRTRYGMPFSNTPRQRVVGTGRACRAIAAARLLDPGSEWRVFRALQLGWFTTPALLDEDEAILAAIRDVPGIDAERIVSLLDDTGVVEAYERDRAEARTAAGSPTELQGKSAQTDGPVRYTAPSLIVEKNGLRLEAGGFQPTGAYDVVVANVDPTLTRHAPPDGPLPLLERYREGLSTQEVATLLTHGNDDPDRKGAELALLELAADGVVARTPLGSDAIWTLVG